MDLTKKGREIRARYANLQKKRKRQQSKVGREEEEFSSNRPEIAAFVLALCGTPVTKSMQPSAAESCKKIDEGGIATLS